jgi:hypothetical protein
MQRLVGGRADQEVEELAIHGRRGAEGGGRCV